MNFGMISAATHSDTKLRGAPLGIDNDGRAGR
jgi:hypothetical protein